MGMTPAPLLKPAPSSTPPSADAASSPATLHLVFQGLRSDRGTVRVCLWSEGDGFPDCKAGHHVRKLTVSATADRVVLDVAGLAPGEYGVSAIHDENDNRRLDKSFVGLPTEGVAFSNNASAPFGPPKFGKVRFPVTGPTQQTLQLRYYL